MEMTERREDLGSGQTSTENVDTKSQRSRILEPSPCLGHIGKNKERRHLECITEQVPVLYPLAKTSQIIEKDFSWRSNGVWRKAIPLLAPLPVQCARVGASAHPPLLVVNTHITQLWNTDKE